MFKCINNNNNNNNNTHIFLISKHIFTHLDIGAGQRKTWRLQEHADCKEQIARKGSEKKGSEKQ